MPNHCSNVMSVCGSPADVDAFVKKVKGPGPNYPSQGPFDGRPEGERAAPEDLDIHILSFHQTVPIPESTQVRGFDSAGYDAQRALWGTKWGAYDQELIRQGDRVVKYSFTTAWCPPTQWLLTTSQMFPELTFYLSYSEESPTRGRFSVRNGIVLEEAGDSYPFKGDYPEYDEALANSDPTYEDRHYEQCNRITGAYVIGHDYWVGKAEGQSEK